MVESKSEEGAISRPESTDATLRWAKVLNVGPGQYDSMDNLIVPDAKEGDVVYAMAHGIESAGLEDIGYPNLKVANMLDTMARLVDIETLTIEPFGNLVEIIKLKRPEETAGGIMRPDSCKPPPNIAIVKSVGAGWFGATGKRIPVGVEPGQLIAYKPYETMVVDFSTFGINRHTYLVSVRSILNVINLTKEEREEFDKKFLPED